MQDSIEDQTIPLQPIPHLIPISKPHLLITSLLPMPKRLLAQFQSRKNLYLSRNQQSNQYRSQQYRSYQPMQSPRNYLRSSSKNGLQQQHVQKKQDPSMWQFMIKVVDLLGSEKEAARHFKEEVKDKMIQSFKEIAQTKINIHEEHTIKSSKRSSLNNNSYRKDAPIVINNIMRGNNVDQDFGRKQRCVQQLMYQRMIQAKIKEKNQPRFTINKSVSLRQSPQRTLRSQTQRSYLRCQIDTQRSYETNEKQINNLITPMNMHKQQENKKIPQTDFINKLQSKSQDKSYSQQKQITAVGVKQQKESEEVNQFLPKAVLMQISFNENKDPSLSLAEAFKKKKMKLSSERSKSTINKIYQMKQQQKIEKLINKKINNENKIKQQKIEMSLRKQINTPRQKIKKEDLKSKQRKINNGQIEKSIHKELKSPSKELLNRLIYGEKATISKEQMYALTKKNYERLPQVEAKKKQIFKKQQQITRLQKIKEFQKKIRKKQNLL